MNGISSPTSIPPPGPISPSLISLVVSVDVKHHVYLFNGTELKLTTSPESGGCGGVGGWGGGEGGTMGDGKAAI